MPESEAVRSDAGKRNVAAEPENQQRADRESDTARQLLMFIDGGPATSTS